MTALADAYRTLQSGTLWSSTGKCRGFAVANPGEAAKIDAYVAALSASGGQSVTAPSLTTATGKGIVGMLAALAFAPPPTPPTPPPPPALGWLLPARMPEATWPITVVSTPAALAAALAAAPAGSRIQLRAGTYGAGNAAALTVRTNGIPTAPVCVEAFPGEQATIAQMAKTVGGAVRFRNLTFARNAYPTDVRYGQGGSNPGGNVNVYVDSDHVELDRCSVRGATMSGIFVGDNGGHDVQVWKTVITDNGTTPDDHGIYWGGGGAGSLAADCLIAGNARFGLQIQYAVAGLVAANCTLSRNGVQSGGSGVVQVSPARDLLYVNCVSDGNGEVGFKSYAQLGANTRILRSVSHDPQGPTYGPFDAADVLNADPLLGQDYRPGPGSPAIAAGDPGWCPPDDLYSVARLTPTMGCVAA